MSFDEKLKKILSKHADLGDKLSFEIRGEEFVKISKEYSDLENIVAKINEYYRAKKTLINLQDLLKTETDTEVKVLILDEIKILDEKIPNCEKSVKLALLPKDKADVKNAIIEVRAGTGGEEAALFAYTLFHMYQRYSEAKKWKFEILAISETGIGGYKEASALITGNGVFAKMKFEAGVHRVQRIPETESSGRIHTSAATVAVLPEAEDIDVSIDEKDLRIDLYRSSGAGGQHVNTTDSAVRITHIPTGIVVTQQDERSQHKNKARALKVLKSKIYEIERERQKEVTALSRRGQVKSGDRSERIRTYNFPQGRVTDHRINLTLYKINEMVKEGDLDDLINALIASDEAEKLSSCE